MMRRAGRFAAACAVGLLLASCMTAAGPPPSTAGRGPAPTTAAAVSTTQAEATADTEAADTAQGELATPLAPPMPSRSAGATVPFSIDDLLPSAQRALPEGLQRSLGLADRPGPLLEQLGSMGFSALWDEPFMTVFAPWDAPVDEVRVLTETVAVRDGVLRGLVRNWSRHLWAYEVTVSVGGLEFVWPLSVQPGEIAPFEIHGWDGPADADSIEFAVDAQMSWHIDPSRAFERGDGPTLWVGTTTQRLLPDDLRERYPTLTSDIASDSVSLGIAHWQTGLVKPTSHPSLAGEIGDHFASSGHLVVDDLRGYGAVFDYAGRVLDVSPATLTDLRRSLIRAAPPDLEVRSVPDPGLRHGLPYTLDVLLDVYVEDLEPEEGTGEHFYASRKDIAEEGEIAWYRATYNGGFVLWVGAAFPSHPLS